MEKKLSSSNKLIAKNALFLYFRLLFTLSIGLYASRLILNILGVVDYGIYNVVGGVVALFAFLQASLSGATTRFLNIHMLNGIEQLKIVFNTALIMHFILAIVILIFSETLGLWLVVNKLSIPENRMTVSIIVYQLSVVSVIVSILQIPYDAAIIANEKMNIYASFSILKAIFNLILIFFVRYLPYDKLFVYAILILIVSIIVLILVQLYCRNFFLETKFAFLFDRKIFKDMTSFFGWDLYGNMSVVLKIQGVNIIQNIFFGPVINASVAIVSQAQSGLSTLGSNLALAATPQMIQCYSKNDINRMFLLLSQGTRLAFYLVLIVSLPLVFYPKYILGLWLGTVPYYADSFLSLSLLSSIISISFLLLNPIIHATGKMFRISFITGSIYLVSLPLTYMLFKYGFSPMAPYYLNFVIVILAGITNLYIVQKYIPQFKVSIFFRKVLFRMYMVFFCSSLAAYVISNNFKLYPIFSMLIIVFFIFILILSIGINKTERKYLLNLIRTFIRSNELFKKIKNKK
ncbi:hypothetical protein [Psychrobacter sp. BF1]|uniref:hypothetical protein n=1 Tax=Psychrobacter sp. BF1 TaxID=2821147 RepID=UPI001C4DEB21|nr:hypothetical protein [Psychrobacter sp. BF1]